MRQTASRWRRLVRLAGATSVACFVTGSAMAAPITYIYRGTGSGTLDSVPFTNTAFTFRFHGDTDNLTNNAIAWINAVELAPSTITLQGQPTATVTGDTYAYGGFPAGVAGFGTVEDADAFILGAPGSPIPALASYDMASPIGPVVGPVHPVVAVNGGTLRTSLGLLEFTSYSATGSFQAVPEPAMVVLLAAGLGAACAQRVRQRT